MRRKPHSRKKRTRKSVLRLPVLEHAKAAALKSLTSPDAQRGYRHAIDEFVDWYCSEPRLAFNRIVVFAIGLISNPVSSLRAQSICVLAPCDDSHTKLPIAVCSVRTRLPEFAE